VTTTDGEQHHTHDANLINSYDHHHHTSDKTMDEQGGTFDILKEVIATVRREQNLRENMLRDKADERKHQR
jgi:hypothetical protein